MINTPDFESAHMEFAFMRETIICALLERLGNVVSFTNDELDSAAWKLYLGKQKTSMEKYGDTFKIYIEESDVIPETLS